MGQQCSPCTTCKEANGGDKTQIIAPGTHNSSIATSKQINAEVSNTKSENDEDTQKYQGWEDNVMKIYENQSKDCQKNSYNSDEEQSKPRSLEDQTTRNKKVDSYSNKLSERAETKPNCNGVNSYHQIKSPEIEQQSTWQSDQLENQIQKGQDNDKHQQNSKYFGSEKEIPEKKQGDNQGRKKQYKFITQAVYDGEWKGNVREGYGESQWPDGGRYEGEWLNDKAHGKGKFFHVDGDIYEGEWQKFQANGKGIYIHANGERYEGMWKDDLQHGQGVETWNDGSRYDGNYVEGKKQGKGIYTWIDGSKYEGEWNDNKMCGMGEYLQADGRMFRGDWLNNKMHGKGIYTWKDDRKYEGEFQNDKKHGYGVYTWSDGRKYEGEWKNGKQHGKGKYFLLDGTIKTGIWEDGKHVLWIEEGERDAGAGAAQ